MDAVDMAAAIRRRKLGVHELVSAHVERCLRLNPHVNAIVSPVFERALAEAADADKALARGAEPGPLFGLPVAHKDSFLTRGLRTTFGSRAFSDNVPTQDSAVVAHQKAAGAICLGKTNMPELGAGSHTFNEIFGATHNPYDLDLSAGGSSGGAAAALAAGFVALADGSDMGGSLRNPASFCNVVGLRPSIGRVPMVPNAYPFNTLTVGGPLGRSVADVALLLDVIARSEDADPLSLPPPAQGFAQIDDIDPRGVRVALSPTLGGLPLEAGVAASLREGVRHLQTMGCIVEEDEPDFSDADFAFETLRALIFSTNYGPLRAQRGELLKDTLRQNIDQGLALDGKTIAEAERARARMFVRMQTLLSRHEFLVAPVSQVLPFPVEQEFPTSVAGTPMPDYLGWMRSSYRITVTGHPSISLPCSFTDEGLPVGIQIVGRYRQERALLAFARQFERANPAGRRRPVMSV